MSSASGEGVFGVFLLGIIVRGRRKGEKWWDRVKSKGNRVLGRVKKKWAGLRNGLVGIKLK